MFLSATFTLQPCYFCYFCILAYTASASNSCPVLSYSPAPLLTSHSHHGTVVGLLCLLFNPMASLHILSLLSPFSVDVKAQLRSIFLIYQSFHCYFLFGLAMRSSCHFSFHLGSSPSQCPYLLVSLFLCLFVSLFPCFFMYICFFAYLFFEDFAIIIMSCQEDEAKQHLKLKGATASIRDVIYEKIIKNSKHPFFNTSTPELCQTARL